MSIDAKETIEIDRPRAEVAAYVMDPANDTTWIGGIREVAWITEPPLCVGSRVRRVATFMGRRIDYVLEVVDLDLVSRLVMRSVEAPFPMVVTYSFSERGGSAVAGVRVQGGAGALFGIAAPLIARQVARSLRGDLRRLKTRLEETPVRPLAS